MKKKNMIGKITAVLSGISLIGATIMGATALSYPDPFIKDGSFNGNIVVGSTAAPVDIVGSIDIGTSLQYYMKQPADLMTGSQDATIDNGYKIQKSGDKFNYGDTIADVMDGTSLTEDDLPSVLSDGKYTDTEGDYKNKVDYIQEITFVDGNAELKYTQDDDAAPKADDYLVIKENTPLYQYNLEFNSPVQYNNYNSGEANDDWKTTTLNIQGKTYTISDVSVTGTDGKMESITLMSGESVMWLTQNQPIDRIVDGVEHTIEVVDVTEPSKSNGEVDCQIRVDGVTSIVDMDTSKTINGVQIGVTDARAIHAQLQDVDVCQIALSANEIELSDGDEVKIDGIALDGTEVTFQEENGGDFEGFTISYDADSIDDTVFLKSGEAFTDPVFNSWKIVYGGLTADYNEYSIKTSGDSDATFEFTNNDNKEVQIPFYLNDTEIMIGDGDDNDELYFGTSTYGDSLPSVCTGTSTVDDCEGMKIIATPATNGEVHIFEITDIDVEQSGNWNGTLDIKDLTYGRTYNDLSYTENVNTLMNLGSFGNLIGLNVSEENKNITVSNTINSQMELKNNEKLTIVRTPTNVNMKITEGDAGNNILNVDIKADSDNEIDIRANWVNSGTTTTELEEDSDYTAKVSAAGTKVIVDDEGTSIEIKSLNDDDEAYGSVFIAPISSKMSSLVSNAQTFTLNKIGVGASKLDTEISDATAQNMIVVGGPCISKVAAQVMGKTFPACGADSGIAENTAMIKAVAQSTGRVVILVAGFDASDTRRATRVLANYDKYNLSLSPGVTYDITGTDFDNIQVVKSS